MTREWFPQEGEEEGKKERGRLVVLSHSTTLNHSNLL